VVGNLDCVIIMEEPKIGPYRVKIAGSIAGILEVPENTVNIKAKTAEKLGSIGKGEAVAAYAAVLLTDKK